MGARYTFPPLSGSPGCRGSPFLGLRTSLTSRALSPDNHRTGRPVTRQRRLRARGRRIRVTNENVYAVSLVSPPRPRVRGSSGGPRRPRAAPRPGASRPDGLTPPPLPRTGSSTCPRVTGVGRSPAGRPKRAHSPSRT